MTRSSRKQPSSPSSSPVIVKNAMVWVMTFVALVLLSSLVLSVSFIVQRLTQKQQQQRMVVGSTWNELVGLFRGGDLTCEDVRRQFAAADPNQGKIYSRSNQMTDPSFALSLHSQAYDPSQWDLYNEESNNKGRNDWAHARFLQILAPETYQNILRSAEVTDAAAARRRLRQVASARKSSDGTKKPVSLVMDVGAGTGYYSMLAMALGYSTLAFDINPPNLLRMCESLELNHWSLPENDQDVEGAKVRLYPSGVSDVNGKKVNVWTPKKQPGKAFMKQVVEEGITDERAQTTTVTLDAFARQHGWLIPQSKGSLAINPHVEVKILKIDVEGHEPHVLEGAQALLRSGIVENLLVEFGSLRHPNVQHALLMLLESGYTLIHDDEGRVSLTRAKELLVQLTNQEEEGERQSHKAVDLWFQRIH